MEQDQVSAGTSTASSTDDLHVWGRHTISEMRRALNEGEPPALEMAGSGGWSCARFSERVLQKFCALLSAAVCYVAAIAWLLVVNGELGLDTQDRPIRGWDLVSFFCLFSVVTVGCFVGVYKLQKMKYRAVAKELENMYTLQESARGELSDATAAKSENTGTLLNAQIPSLTRLVSKSRDTDAANAATAIFRGNTAYALATEHRDLIASKFRAEGIQHGASFSSDVL